MISQHKFALQKKDVGFPHVEQSEGGSILKGRAALRSWSPRLVTTPNISGHHGQLLDAHLAGRGVVDDSGSGWFFISFFHWVYL